MPKVSIIIPIYNTEKYLAQCLDSITSQTFEDFEYICVNDGSTDNSLKILEQYANKDNRLKIINQKNKGSSAARNMALKHIKGKYISFIDSDDFVAKDFLEKLVNIAEKDNSDIVYCRHTVYCSADNKYIPDKNKEKLKKLFYKYSKTTNNKIKKRCILNIVENSSSVCFKLYKSSIIKNNDICFFENIYAEEDYAFNILTNIYSSKISFLEEDLYFYRKQITSITAKNTDDFRINSIKSFILLTKVLNTRNLLIKNKILMRFISHKFLSTIGKNLSIEKQKEILPEIYEHIKFFKDININYNINLKIRFYLFLIKVLKINSFVIFKILKNLQRF